MNDRGIKSAIIAKIGSLPDDTAFTATDFADIASSDNTRRAFKELADEGAIAKAVRGVYYKPRYNSTLRRNVPPDIDKVAQAVARARGWEIVPSGDHALNMLGLDTQVPAVYSYISTGPYVSIQAGPYDIKFKHAANKNITGMSQTTALIIQALKALGKDNVTDETVANLAAKLDALEKALLLQETERTTTWMRQAVERIAKGGTA